MLHAIPPWAWIEGTFPPAKAKFQTFQLLTQLAEISTEKWKQIQQKPTQRAYYQ